MAVYDSAYLLGWFNRLTGRPQGSGATDSIAPVDKFKRLAEAQDEVIADIAAICPWVLYPTVSYANMPQLSTVDNQVWTFGTDANGYPIAPMGKTMIYPDLNSIPGCPWQEGTDYLNEGTQIRIPYNNTYAGPLYWRGITPPAAISATVQPALFPEASRELIALRAAYNFGQEGTRNLALSDAMAERYGYPLSQNGAPGRFAFWCTSWQNAFTSGGALSAVTGQQLAYAGYSSYQNPI